MKFGYIEGYAVVHFFFFWWGLIAINNVEILESGQYDKDLLFTFCVSKLLLSLHV